MDEIVRRAMEKWPRVPAAHGWLSLDRRGRWLIKGEPITHPLLIQFIARNYACDDAGRWYFQNGPQRVFVTLAYAPWVVRSEFDSFATHTGRSIDSLEGVWIDEEGVIVLSTNLGPATLDDRDNDLVCSSLVQAEGLPLGEDALIESVEAIIAGHERVLTLPYKNRSVPVGPIRRSEVSRRFGFVTDPSAAPQEAPADASAA